MSIRTQIQIKASTHNGQAVIRITSVVGANTDDQSNSEALRKSVDAFLSQGVTKARVYINSPGGSVFEANEIVNELKRFADVKIELGALAASAATYIIAHFHTTAKRNTRLMIHKPMGGAEGTVDEFKSYLKLLQSLTEDYRNAYATKMGITAEKVDELWGKGDYWMTAQEALAIKLIDAIEGEGTVTKTDAMMIAACGFKDKIKITNIVEREQLIQILGLQADATDEQILTALQDAKSKADQFDASQQEDEEQSAEQKAEALVNAAIVGKKLTAAQKATFVALAVANLEGTRAAIDAMPVIKPISSQIVPPGSGRSKEDKERAEWDLDKWLEEDPEALAEMEKTDPKKFEILNQKYFKK